MSFLQISRNRGEAVSERRHRLQDSRTSGRRKEAERGGFIFIQSVLFDVGFGGIRRPGEIISNLEKQPNNLLWNTVHETSFTPTPPTHRKLAIE